MRRLAAPVRAVLVACLLGALAACESRPPIEIDLTAVDYGVVDGRFAPLPVAGPRRARRLVQRGPGTLELFVRLPARSRLVFGLPSGVPADAFAVSVAGDEAGTALAPAPAGEGEWEASLGHFDGTPVRLRFENRAGTELAWLRPRVVGVERPAPALLPDAAPPPGERVNVLLYVVDTLRADHLSAYGYERPTSPRLERLARRAVLFENAHSLASHTGPSVTSLFSSRFPSELSARLDADGAARHTLAEMFQAAGYDTAAFQANFSLLEGRGFGRGFNRYELLSKRNGDGRRTQVKAGVLHEHVLAWLRAHTDGPFFVYVQSMDPHDPYAPPEPFREQFAPRQAAPSGDDAAAVEALGPGVTRALSMLERFDPKLYDGEVAYADHELADLVAALGEMGVAERTAIVITADHGEPLGEHGEFLHGRTLYQELVHVPLVLVLPWRKGGERVDTVVSLLDVAPTLLDLAGIPVPTQFLGHSFLRPRGPRPPPVVGEQWAVGTRDVTEWYVREGPWKLILDRERARLFHLPSDPDEEHDVSAEHPVTTGYLRTLAMARSPAFRTGGRLLPPASGLSPEERRREEEALKALGYVD